MLCNQASNKMSKLFHACCRHIHFRSSCGCSANCGSNFSEWSGWQVPLLLGGWKLREPMLLFMHELHIHIKFFSYIISSYKTMNVKCPILFPGSVCFCSRVHMCLSCQHIFSAGPHSSRSMGTECPFFFC